MRSAHCRARKTVPRFQRCGATALRPISQGVKQISEPPAPASQTASTLLPMGRARARSDHPDSDCRTKVPFVASANSRGGEITPTQFPTVGKSFRGGSGEGGPLSSSGERENRPSKMRSKWACAPHPRYLLLRRMPSGHNKKSSPI